MLLRPLGQIHGGRQGEPPGMENAVVACFEERALLRRELFSSTQIVRRAQGEEDLRVGRLGSVEVVPLVAPFRPEALGPTPRRRQPALDQEDLRQESLGRAQQCTVLRPGGAHHQRLDELPATLPVAALAQVRERGGALELRVGEDLLHIGDLGVVQVELALKLRESSVEALGFDFDDIEILLTTQAHWDHVASLAEIRRLTGARMLAHQDDVAVLEDGGSSDFRFPDGREPFFEPIAVDGQLQHGDTIELGGTVLTLHHHPGHTRGASSFTFETNADGETYSVLVVQEGIVVKNRLYGVVAEEEEDEPKKAGWLAYTPPPLMVPMDYQNTDKWNRFETKWVNGIFVSAMVMDRMNWMSQDENSETRWGDLSVNDGGEIRGFRAGLVGSINFEKPWIYTFFAATNAFDKGFEVHEKDSLSIFDYRMDIPFFNNSVMSIGKQKEPINMDRLTGGTFLPNQERSAVADAFMPSRNVGVVWNGSSPERRTNWAFGVFDDFIEDDDAISPSDSTNRQIMKENIHYMLQYLTPREQKIIRMRFGLDDGIGHTLEEVGREFGVTRERIRQIEAKILQKMRDHPTSIKIKDRF